jgi:hypothetical protein
LTEADVETLLTLSTAPCLSIPLILEFLNNGKVDLLGSSDARVFIESIIYTFGPYQHDFLPVDMVPHDTEKKPYGTRYGLLFHEVWREPEAVMSAAVRLSYSAARLCSNISFRNNLADALFFIILLDLTLLQYASTVEQFESETDISHLPWQGHIIQFLVEVALPILHNWISEAEKASASANIVNLSVYVAICEAARLLAAATNKELMNEDARTVSIASFLASCCHAVQWLDKAALKDEFHLPSALLFTIMQRTRNYVMIWCDEQDSKGHHGRRNRAKVLESAQLFTLREKSFHSAIMELGQLDPTLWRSTSDDLCLTQHVVQSEHPYPFDVQAVEKIEIVDAPYLLLSFDSRSTLGQRSGASVTIYADKEQTKMLLVRLRM